MRTRFSNYGNWKIIIILSTCLITSAAFGQSSILSSAKGDSSLPAGSGRSLIESNQGVLLFFYVRDGKIMKTAYTLRDLYKASAVTIDGYVAGTLVFCEKKMDIHVGDMQMRKAEEGADGSLFLDYFGRVNPKGYWNSYLPQSAVFHGAKSLDGKGASFQKYEAFPETVLPDTISSGDRFKMLFQQKDSSFELIVHHNGYRKLPQIDAPAEPTTAKTVFRYLGNRVAAIEKSPDFAKRLDAIAEGIGLVEKTFDLKLVRNVNVVDCESIENAITRAGYNDIWFFIDTFQRESITELKTIAEHETLHLLVDRYQFTQAYQVRKLFADLRGYDELSADRFFLLTQGAVKEGSDSCALINSLFSFIDEKNFLRRKGGHSHQNLDEFCTSLIHSLMYLSRIQRNLDLPVISNANTTACLTKSEKTEILEYYLKSIRIFLQKIAIHGGNLRTTEFFENKRAYIEALVSRKKTLMSATVSYNK